MVERYLSLNYYTMKLKPSLLNLSLCIQPLTFITEVLRLVDTTKKFICLLLWLVQCHFQHFCLACTIRCVTKAMPFQFIDGNILKSCRMGFTNHTRPISYHTVWRETLEGANFGEMARKTSFVE